jgi:hypothetical protein
LAALVNSHSNCELLSESWYACKGSDRDKGVPSTR